jgi:chromosome segregation protein
MQSCDQLYGITMPQRGVSKRVSVRFEQVGKDGTIAKEAVDAAQAEEAQNQGQNQGPSQGARAGSPEDANRPSDALAGAWERN